jgi:hypothetical protein
VVPSNRKLYRLLPEKNLLSIMRYPGSLALTLVLLGIACSTFAGAAATAPAIAWARTYSIGLECRALDVIQTRDGGYVIAGYALVANNTSLPYYPLGRNYNAFLIRTDERGNVVWNRTYGNTSSDGAFAVRETLDGGLIIAGYASGAEHQDADRYLVRTDGGGCVVWERHFTDNNGFDTLYGVCALPNGDFIVGGETDQDQPYGNRVAYLARTDGNGTIIWEIPGVGYLSGGSEPFGYISGSLDCTGDEGYLLGAEGGIVKTNEWGAVLWTAHHDSLVTYARMAPEGGAVATGITQSPDTGYPVPNILKTNSSGWTVWETLSPDTWGSGRAVEVTSDGGFLAVGTAIILKGGMQADKTIPFSSAISLVKTDGDGRILWNTTLSLAPYNEGMMVRETSDGGYIVLGNIADEAGQEELYWMGYLRGQIYLAKLDGDGTCQEKPMTISTLDQQGEDIVPEQAAISTPEQESSRCDGEGFPGLPIPLGPAILTGILMLFFMLGRKKR